RADVAVLRRDNRVGVVGTVQYAAVRTSGATGAGLSPHRCRNADRSAVVTIAESLNEFGFAPVLAYTRGAPSKDVVDHFSEQQDSQLTAVSTRSALALRADRDAAYGTVDRDGLSGLKASPEVADVTYAPQLSLIRPVAADGGTPRRQTS